MIRVVNANNDGIENLLSGNGRKRSYFRLGGEKTCLQKGYKLVTE